MTSIPPASSSGPAGEALDSRLVALSRRVHAATAWAVMLLAVTVLAGWLLGVPELTRLRPDWVAMKANTALGLLLAGVSLWLSRPGGEGRAGRWAVLLALGVALLGALTLAEHLFGWNPGIDEWLARDAMPPPHTTHPGRMSGNAALSFLFLGLALAFIDRETRHGRRLAEWLAAAAAMPAFLALIGYAYDLREITGLLDSTALAPHTAIAVLLLVAGILAARPEAGGMRWFVSRGLVGFAARVLLPGSIGLLVLIGFLAAWGARSGLYGPATRGALFLGAGVGALLFFLTRAIAQLAVLEARFAQEINERMAAQEALRDSRQRFAGIVESAMDAIISIDSAQRIVLFNAAAEAMFGCRAAEALGSPIERFIPAHFRAAHAGHIERFGATGTTSRAMGCLGQVYGLRGDGKEFPVEASISQVEVGGEKLYTVILRDISARVAAEAEIRRFNSDLENLVEARTAELKAANAELETYAYAIAHDLRTPLRAIGGFSRMVATNYGERLDEVGHQYLEQVIAGAHRMGDLIEGLLQLSRSTRGELVRLPVDLSALARRILDEFVAAEPGRPVRIEIEAGLMVEGDSRMLEALMRNLLGNAWKYTGNTPEALIRVHAERASDPLRYCVSDNGAGFDMAHAGQLFQPFRRLHRQDEFPGIGIGLATVKRIVHRHGGEIAVQAAPGRGASFCFTLRPGQARERNSAPANLSA